LTDPSSCVTLAPKLGHERSNLTYLAGPPEHREAKSRLPVLKRASLCATDVRAVAEGRALAVVIPHYYDHDACSALAARLLGAKNLWSHYPNGSGAEHIATLGDALYSCMGDELSSQCTNYFHHAACRNRELRDVAAPLIHPADQVRIDLDNEWPAGATLLRIEGKPAFFGLCRSVRDGGGIEVHTDRADWDFPSIETEAFCAQLFMNVYLSQSERGGDLELWAMSIPTKAEYEQLRSPKSTYALDRRLIPKASTTIKLNQGTLVIGNASRPHAVTPCEGSGSRLSASGFFGYAGPHAPLRAFS